MFGIDEQQDQGFGTGDRLVDRVMTMEYNLAVQRGVAGAPQATSSLARLFGFWLASKFSS